ncbi:unnamed protein product [Prorocentrum cordatum]|uniref:Uncharacterized protein n=1 Tax=Prorocentrum cordatum TaxID=2364126 RepID=A0ABN9TGC5_9DINO|nr:unnamed protein product [Polarella glacialis]
MSGPSAAASSPPPVACEPCGRPHSGVQRRCERLTDSCQRCSEYFCLMQPVRATEPGGREQEQHWQTECRRDAARSAPPPPPALVEPGLPGWRRPTPIRRAPSQISDVPRCSVRAVSRDRGLRGASGPRATRS